jgi:hypothetical protein
MIVEDERALAELIGTISYFEPPPLQRAPARVKTALLAARTPLANVPPNLLQKLIEQFAANIRHPDLKIVTLSDLNSSTNEAKTGESAKGSLLDFSEHQTVMNEAISRGIPLVIFIDLTQFNLRKATVSGSSDLNLLTSRVALTLFNAADGARIKTIDRATTTRGFNADNLADKAFDSVAGDLGMISSRWEVADMDIKLHELEIHAKFGGIHFPVLDFKDPTGRVKVVELPVFAEGAAVEIDGVLKGQAPCRISVSPGTHTLRVRREGAKSFEAKIQVQGPSRFDALLVPDESFRTVFNSQLERFERLKTLAVARGAFAERADSISNAIRRGSEGALAIDLSNANATTTLSNAKGIAIQKGAEGRLAKDLTAAQSTTTLAEANASAIRKGGEGKLAKDLSTADLTRRTAEGNLARNTAQAQATTTLSEANATAIRQGAEGKLAKDTAEAQEMGPNSQYRTELMRAQAEAFKSFAENLSNLSVKMRF